MQLQKCDMCAYFIRETAGAEVADCRFDSPAIGPMGAEWPHVNCYDGCGDHAMADYEEDGITRSDEDHLT